MLDVPRVGKRRKNSTKSVGVLGTGVRRLACLRPAAWLKGWPSMAHLHQHEHKTLARGQASSGTASSGWLARRRRDQGGVPHEVPVTQAMTTEARRVPGGRRPAQSPCFLFGAKGASAGEGIKQRQPFWCNKTKTSRTAGWRSSWSPSWCHTRAFGRRGPTLVRISVLDVPLQNGQLLAPFPLNIWEEARGLCL